MLRLLSDENFNGDIVRGLLLREPDLDLVRAQDVRLEGADDPDVLGTGHLARPPRSARGCRAAASIDVLLEPLGDRVEVRRQVEDTASQGAEPPGLTRRGRGRGAEGGYWRAIAGEDDFLSRGQLLDDLRQPGL